MRRLSEMFPIVLFVFSLLQAPGCSGRRELASAVSRATVGDTLVVTTVPPPEPGSSLYNIELDLKIGVEEGPEEYVLLSPGSVSADGEGNIYTSDQQNGEVRIFDREGRHLVTFGRRGDGPGEFNSNFWGIFNIRPVTGDMLTVEDLPGLKVYDRHGGYIREFDLMLILSADRSLYTSTEGLTWLPERGCIVSLWSWMLPDRSRGRRLVVLDEEMSVIRELPATYPPSGVYNFDGGGFSLPFTGSFESCVTGDGYLVWGVSDEYVINIYDLEGGWRKAVLDIEPEPVTGRDIEDWKEGFLSRMQSEEQAERWRPLLNRPTYASVKPFFESITGDDRGRIWVRRYSTFEGPDGKAWYRYDLFDPGAEWMGIVDSPVEMAYIRGDYAYRLDYENYPVIERYRLISQQ